MAWRRRSSPPRSLEAAAQRRAADPDAPPARILSIDGGGIRGLIPATILAELERRTGKSTAEMFDLIAGTSTGAIIALALTVPGPDGKPAWTAQDLVDLYETEGPKIFRRSWLRRLITLGGVLGPKYSDRALTQTLTEYFGDARLSHALTDVLIPAYDTERHAPFFFRSARARRNPAKDFPMSDTVRAATAAPTFFPAVEVVNEISAKRYSLVDGGVFANNPGMCAWADAELAGLAHDAVMLSVGTGELTEPLAHRQVRGWGLRGWATKILDVVFRGVSNTTAYQLRALMGDERYLRLQTRLDLASDKMDRTSAKNFQALRAEAQQVLVEQADAIDQFVQSVDAQGRTPPRPRRSSRQAHELLKRRGVQQTS